MNVLIINTSERIGGAAVAANRLLKALNKNGISAKMLVNNKNSDDPMVLQVPGKWRKKFNFVFERGLIYILNGFNKQHLFDIDPAFTGSDITRLACFKEADVIHLHWVNQGMLNFRDLRKILNSGKPVVWTMHDQWCSTGICHHAGGCEKNMEECSACPLLRRKNRRDLAYWIFQKKLRLYSDFKLRFVTCSQWLRDISLRSLLFENQRVVAIPNPIDTEVFRVLDKQVCRKNLGLPSDKKLVLVGAVNVLDERKGYSYMVDVLNLLAEKDKLSTDVEVVCMGNGSTHLQNALKFKVHPLNFVSEEASLAEIYSAVDMFMTSSLNENLPNMIMEAMACGTPCLGFNVGGIPEMIDHKVNGYVAEYKSVEDLCRGALSILSLGEGEAIAFQLSARRKVEDLYSEKVVVERFKKIYDAF